MRGQINHNALNSDNRLNDDSRESNHIPRSSSRLEISILNMAHGEEPSNYEAKSEEMGHEEVNRMNPIDPNLINETGGINVKFK